MPDRKPSKLVLLDWSLINRAGHGFEYGANVLRAFSQAGWETEAYAHRNCEVREMAGSVVTSLFSYSATDPVARIRLLRPFAKMFVHWTRTASELRDAIASHQAEEVVFFIQHVEPYQLPGVLRAFKNCRGRLLLMLRGTSLDWDGDVARPTFRTFLYRWFLGGLRAMLGERLILVCDSDRLVDEYKVVSQGAVHAVPLPNPDPVFRNRVLDERPMVLLAGRISDEKGARYLPAVIQEVRRRALMVRFRIHIYQAPSEVASNAAVISQLRLLADSDISLVTEPLGSEEYWAESRSASFALMLYDQHRYRNQTSNLLLDCLSSGAFPIVSEGTWLADMVERIGYGAAVSLRQTQADIASQVADILSRPLPPVPETVKQFCFENTATNFERVVSALLNPVQKGQGS